MVLNIKKSYKHVIVIYIYRTATLLVLKVPYKKIDVKSNQDMKKTCFLIGTKFSNTSNLSTATYNSTKIEKKVIVEGFVAHGFFLFLF